MPFAVPVVAVVPSVAFASVAVSLLAPAALAWSWACACNCAATAAAAADVVVLALLFVLASLFVPVALDVPPFCCTLVLLLWPLACCALLDAVVVEPLLWLLSDAFVLLLLLADV